MQNAVKPRDIVPGCERFEIAIAAKTTTLLTTNTVCLKHLAEMFRLTGCFDRVMSPFWKQSRLRNIATPVRYLRVLWY